MRSFVLEKLSTASKLFATMTASILHRHLLIHYIRTITKKKKKEGRKRYGFLSGVDAEVDNQSLLDRESFATNLAAERLQSSMPCQMSFESSYLSKRLLAYVTFEPIRQE